MGSYTRLTYHIVFATKYRQPSITDELREPLYEYIGGILRAKQGHTVQIGGVEDHVHILAAMSPTLAVADVIRDMKANSSKWMNERPGSDNEFQWQKGYGAFTVSYDKIASVTRYIQNQRERHRTKTFQEEYIEFLRLHDIKFRVEQLFEDECVG